MARKARVQSEDQSPEPGNFQLQPGETRYGTITWLANWFYEDADYTVPGTYDIALELTGRADDEMDRDDGFIYVGTVTTPASRLTRIEPQGEDAIVWQRLREAARDHWPSHGFGSRVTRENVGDEIVARHPNSAYYPYALLLRRLSPALTLTQAQEAIDRFATSPIIHYLLIAASNTAHSEAWNAEHRNATPTETERYKQLELSYDKAALNTGNRAIRRAAQSGVSAAEADIARLRGMEKHQ